MQRCVLKPYIIIPSGVSFMFSSTDLLIQYEYAIFALLLFLGIFASKISSWIRIPTLLMFLLIGVLAGSEGLGRIQFSDFSAAAKIGTLALVFILFSGGYDTSWKSVRKVLVPGTILCTFGVFMTAILIGVFAAWLLKWDLRSGLLLGAVVSSTDAAAVFALFRSKNTGLKGNLRPLLEYESGSNDPMATFLTIFMIEMVQTPDMSFYSFFYLFPLRIGVGTLVGFLVGKYIAHLMNLVKLDYDGLYYVIGIATVLLSYSASEIFQGNGFMAVYVCGLTLGNSRFIYKHGLGRFHDGIAWLMQVTLFLTLGLLATPSQIPSIALEGSVLALFIMFVARPVSVFLSLIGSHFNFREQLLISWGGIRGAAPIVLAIFPCLAFVNNPDLEPTARTIFHIVFFIVIWSVLIQGKTLMRLARWLGLDEVARTKSRPPLEFEETGISSNRMYEFYIGEHSPALGIAIKDLFLPDRVLVYLIRRDGIFILPRGGTIVQLEDELLMLMDPEIAAQIERLFLPPDEIKSVEKPSEFIG